MGGFWDKIAQTLDTISRKFNLGLRAKLIIIFIFAKVLPLGLMAAVAWWHITNQGTTLRSIAVEDSAIALNNIAVGNIERMTTEAANTVANFLYDRDDDILYLSKLPPSEESYRLFVENVKRKVLVPGPWAIDEETDLWAPVREPAAREIRQSSNVENIDRDGFKYRPPDDFFYTQTPIYDEITFIDLNGQEIYKAQPKSSSKINYPLKTLKHDVSKKENTYVGSETYFAEIKDLKPGEIYVSDLIGAYVGTNFLGMYTPKRLAAASKQRGYDIEYAPGNQAFSGTENPIGQRYEGLIRWVTPVANEQGEKIGYVTMALNHDHIMELVDHLTPMNERFQELSNSHTGNYAFIWSNKGRSVVHPRHHSIAGFNPETGDWEVPWLEATVYNDWQASGVEDWNEFRQDYPIFHEQSREKKPAMSLTKNGYLGLDCRYLNHAPQCIGWMDLTESGGSGSFYILWTGLYKLTTAAAIPYYTGQFAPSAENNFSKRGFGFVAIGSELDFFTAPAQETEAKLTQAINEDLGSTFFQLVASTIVLTILVIFIAIWMASFISNRITYLIGGITRFRSGERQFRFATHDTDEFGVLANSFDEMADSIVDSVNDPLSILDMDQNIRYMNAHTLKLGGHVLADVVGKPYHDYSIYSPNSPSCPLLALREGREAEIIYLKDLDAYFRGVAHYLLNKDGTRVGYIVQSLNLTDMVLRQIALKKAKDAATQASAHKSEFLARMSHEIRTPMNAIIGLTHVSATLLDEIKNKNNTLLEIQENINHVENSSQHLLGLLNDILEVSKIEAGKIVLTSEPMEISAFIDSISSIIKPRCIEKGIDFTINCDTFTTTNFTTDPLRLRQVLINLLGNAVKFTPELGSVNLIITNQGSENGKTKIRFEVKDTGIGISPSSLANIFRPFEQGAANITSNYGGTGLGLTVSRHIVKLFGGDIEIKSEPGSGSEFSFAIWLKEEHTTSAKTEKVIDKATALLDKKILLVDDVDLNRKVVKSMLKKTGAIIDEAGDGDVAVEKFRESPHYNYDIILMDIQMPTMNGYQATEQIRASDRPDAQTVPIIALTANAFSDDIEKGRDAGMNSHIAKPVKPQVLLDTILGHLYQSEENEG